MVKASQCFKPIARVSLAIGIVGSIICITSTNEYWICANARGYAFCFMEDGWLGIEVGVYQPNPDFVLTTGAYHIDRSFDLRAGEMHMVRNWIDYRRGMFRADVPSWLILAISSICACLWIAGFFRRRAGARGFKVNSSNQRRNG
jgi:hypothetical protein